MIAFAEEPSSASARVTKEGITMDGAKQMTKIAKSHGLFMALLKDGDLQGVHLKRHEREENAWWLYTGSPSVIALDKPGVFLFAFETLFDPARVAAKSGLDLDLTPQGLWLVFLIGTLREMGVIVDERG